jgi:uncharacterized protein DUF6894
MRYFFDTRDDGVLLSDDAGLEVGSLSEVKVLAAKSLAELAADVLPCSAERCLGVDVRDREGPVLTTELTFRAIVLKAAA